MTVPEYLSKMVRRRPPSNCAVMSGTVPVVSFGDARTARVATLGINPSWGEFANNGQFLSGAKRRLATLDSLGADDPCSLSDVQVATVVEECARYFAVNPYWKWFKPLNEILTSGLDVSYENGSACHLDLVQWATDPVWRELDDVQKVSLLTDGAPHLAAQLESENVTLVVVNGRQVWDQLCKVGLARPDTVGEIRFGHHQTKSQLRVASGLGATFVGWTVNVQGAFGDTTGLRASLAEWLRSVAPLEVPAPHVDGLLPATSVTTKREFANLLRRWFMASDADTIGTIGNYGGTAHLVVHLGGYVVVLNADTKRHAVAKYLETVDRVGADAPWRVMANAKGLINKVEFTTGGSVTPGWYCYLKIPLGEETLI